MDILGVGPFEFIFFLILALLVLGPERMISTSRGIARFIRNVLTSPTWRTVQDVQREMQTLPTQLIREAGLEDIEQVIPSIEEIGKEAGLDQLQQDVNKLKTDLSGWSAEAPTIRPVPRPTPPPGSPDTPPAASSAAPTIQPAPAKPAPVVPQTSSTASSTPPTIQKPS